MLNPTNIYSNIDCLLLITLYFFFFLLLDFLNKIFIIRPEQKIKCPFKFKEIGLIYLD